MCENTTARLYSAPFSPERREHTAADEKLRGSQLFSAVTRVSLCRSQNKHLAVQRARATKKTSKTNFNTGGQHTPSKCSRRRRRLPPPLLLHSCWLPLTFLLQHRWLKFHMWPLLVFLPNHSGGEEFVGLCLKGRIENTLPSLNCNFSINL